MQSIKSRALEPTRVELAAMSRKSALLSMLPVYGLPILGLCPFIFFSLILPTTFPTLFNFRSLLSDKAIVAVLALASMVPMMVECIDLTVGYGIRVVAHSGYQSANDLRRALAGQRLSRSGGRSLRRPCERHPGRGRPDRFFIATLGTGTVIYAIALWHTEGRQIIGALPENFLEISALVRARDTHYDLLRRGARGCDVGDH